MKKKIFLGTIIVLVVFLGGAGWWYYDHLQIVKSPERVVKSFYDKWLSYEGNPLADRLYQNNRLMTPEFAKVIDRLAGDFVQSGIDPILCAEGKPISFELKPMVSTDELSTIGLVEKFSATEKTVMVDLVKTGEAWAIDSIRCESMVGGRSSNSTLSAPAETLVGDYIKTNINMLSPKPAVLGGKFYVTSISFSDNETALVKYEDGHVALEAEVKFTIGDMEEVQILQFAVLNQ